MTCRWRAVGELLRMGALLWKCPEESKGGKQKQIDATGCDALSCVEQGPHVLAHEQLQVRGVRASKREPRSGVDGRAGTPSSARPEAKITCG